MSEPDHFSLCELPYRARASGSLHLSLCLIVGGLTIMLYVASRSCEGHESDQELIEAFIYRKSALEEIASMMRSDAGLLFVGPSHTNPHDGSGIGVSSGRIEDYRERLTQAGCLGGVLADLDRDEIRFYCSFRGHMIWSSAKGYVWLSSKPDAALTRETLDSWRTNSNRNGMAYRHIVDGWYLFAF